TYRAFGEKANDVSSKKIRRFRSLPSQDIHDEKRAIHCNYVAHPSPEVVKAGLAKIVTNKALVLGENYSSTKQLNSIQQLLAYSLLIGTKIDIEEIIFNDVVTRFKTKSRHKYISYPRFVLYAREVLLGSEYAQDQKFRSLPDAVIVKDFYKKFYNSQGRVPNRCSSSIGKTRGLLSFSRGIGWEGLITV
ncbi:hypothetical protein Tco_0352155, partial [Tanacetum coccineum]